MQGVARNCVPAKTLAAVATPPLPAASSQWAALTVSAGRGGVLAAQLAATDSKHVRVRLAFLAL